MVYSREQFHFSVVKRKSIAPKCIPTQMMIYSIY